MPLDARNQAGLSRESAACMLYIGSRTLQDYETGKTKMPPTVALNASRLYKKPDLTAQYCKRECEIGQVYCYDITKKPLQEAAIQVYLTYKAIGPYIDNLLHISKDGIIDDTEKEMIEQIILLLMEHEKSIEEMKLSASNDINIPALVKMITEKHGSASQAKNRV